MPTVPHARRFARLGLLGVLTLGSGAAEARIDGEDSPSCGFTSTVFVIDPVGTQRCSGVLVHPRVVLSSRLCLSSSAESRTVLFGESARRARRRHSAQCQAVPESDIAVCLLDRASDIAFTPLAMGCELEEAGDGAPLTLVGFGINEVSTGSGMGHKRHTNVAITAADGDQVYTDGSGEGACFGDAGGPGYFQLPDGSYRVYALTHGAAGTEICGGHDRLLRPQAFVPWIEAHTGFDITPCFDTEGRWQPGPDCRDFALDIPRGHGTWSDACQGGPTMGWSASCGPTYDPDGGETSSETGEGESDGEGEVTSTSFNILDAGQEFDHSDDSDLTEEMADEMADEMAEEMADEMTGSIPLDSDTTTPPDVDPQAQASAGADGTGGEWFSAHATGVCQLSTDPQVRVWLMGLFFPRRWMNWSSK